MSRSTLRKIIELIKSIDFGSGRETDLAKLEAAHDLLTAEGINSEDLNLALENFLTSPARSRQYIYGPTHRGSGRGLLNDLLALEAQ